MSIFLFELSGLGLLCTCDMDPNCKYMYMKKTNSLLILIMCILLYSCNSDGNFDVGEDLVDTQSGILIVDTFQLRLSTVIVDSIPTSGVKQLLCGRYTTAITGSTELVPYFNFDVGDQLTSITDDDYLDSITIKLGYSGYYMGDTTQLQTFVLYRLTESLEFLENESTDDYIFNNSSFPHEEVSLGRISFFPQVTKDSIEFRLDDTLAQMLIDLVRNDAEELKSNESFNDYLMGFVLKSSSDSKCILGFAGDTAGVKLNIYTHLIGPEDDEDKRYVIPLASEGTHFNQTISDRSGTAFADLTIQENELLARNTGNISLIAGSSGYVTRIDFPSLNDIFLYNDRVMIKAQLVLIPSLENNMDFLPETLNFYESNKHNQVGDNLVTTSGSQQTSVSATLYQDKLYPENNYYLTDITEYLSNAFAGNYYETENGLLVTVPYSDLKSRADLLMLNSESVIKYKPQLKLYFLKYE